MVKPTPRVRGRRGVAQRARRLRKFPLCAPCLANGIVRATVVIDHIVRLVDGGPDIDANCQGLCEEHNLEKTTAEQTGNYGYDKDGRPMAPDHPWNQGGA